MRRAFIELPRIREARLIRRTIVIHPLTPRRPTFREIAIPLSSLTLFPSPFVRFRPGEFKSAISCGRYLTPVHSSSRSDTAAILFVRYRATMTEARDWIRFARARARKVLL